MYKITLQDDNCISCTSGTYNENIERMNRLVEKAEKVKPDSKEYSDLVEKIDTLYQNRDKIDFEGYELESYVWVTIRSFENKEDIEKEDLFNTTDELLERLMIDVVGEMG